MLFSKISKDMWMVRGLEIFKMFQNVNWVCIWIQWLNKLMWRKHWERNICKDLLLEPTPGGFKSETKKAVQVVHCPVFGVPGRCPAGKCSCLCLMEEKQLCVEWGKDTQQIQLEAFFLSLSSTSQQQVRLLLQPIQTANWENESHQLCQTSATRDSELPYVSVCCLD